MSTNYNGIITKVKAMESKLLSEDVFSNILSNDTVPDAINYIKNNTNYNFVFKDTTNVSHREQIEELLSFAVYSDFNKLYQFAYSDQKTYLDFIIEKYEISILKKCIIDFVTRKKDGLIRFRNPLISGNFNFDFEKLYNSSSFEEFISHLSDTKYYNLLNDISKSNNFTYNDCLIALDIFNFTDLWQKKDKKLSGDSLKALSEILGREIDLLNIIWIYRCKKYYNVDPAIILNKHVIPINYKLKKHELNELVNSVSIDDFINTLKGTYYGTSRYKIDITNIEQSFNQILLETYYVCSRNYPSSMAPIHAYMFKRINEINKIVHYIEIIRYKVKR